MEMTTREQIKAALDTWPCPGYADEKKLREILAWLNENQSSIRALLSGDIQALKAACPSDWAVIPRVASDETLEIGWVHTADPCWKENVADCYTAMVEAEHPAEKGN